MEGKITAVDENGAGTILSAGTEYTFEKAVWVDTKNSAAVDMDVTFDIDEGAVTNIAKKPSKKEAAFDKADNATAKIGLVAKVLQSLGRLLPGEAGAAARSAGREVASANNQAKKTTRAAKGVDRDVQNLRK